MGHRGAIRETMRRIGAKTGERARGVWENLFQGQTPAVVFVAKCDVSELSIDRIHEGLPTFKRHLGQHGFGMYCVDYTQDFRGY